MKRFLLLWISLAAALAAPPLYAAEAEETPGQRKPRQEVLILNSYHPGFTWSDEEQTGIIEVLQEKDKDWLPVIEYLDLKRLPDGRHLGELKKLFLRKHQDKKFSLVIAMDNPALEFAIDNQADLFGNAPLVFCGINNYEPSLLKGRANVTGTAEDIDVAGTIELMLRLHPAAREIFIPHDYTTTSLAARKELEALIPRFGARVRFRFTDPLTMEELLKELERLSPDSLVLLSSFFTDKSGRTFSIEGTTRLFSEHSPVPIYSTNEQRLGFGIVGGKLLGARHHGAHTARIALRVLAGEKASAIPVAFKGDSRFMFDYRVLSRFDIPLSALPEGSTVINKPVSFYATHRTVIQSALGAIAFLGAVIALLLINIIQRRRSVMALHRSEENFRRSIDDSPLGVRIVTAEGETIYANQAILDMYGYDSIEELRTTPLRKRYTPESYAEFQIRWEKRRQGAYSPSNYEVNIVRKDGEIRHLQVFRKEVIWNGARQFQVLYQDITKRRRAEENIRILADLIDISPLAITVHDLKGNFLYANRRTLDLHGYSKDELFARNLHEIDAPASSALIEARIQQIMEIGKARFEVEHYRKDGTRFPLEVFAKAAEWGGQKVILSIATDITDRKQAEEEIHDSREQMRALAGRLQAGREEERTQIAREIHDELGGALTALKIDFSFLMRAAMKIENGAVRTSMLAGTDSIIKSIDAAIQAVRRIAMELRPGILDDLGLVAALEWQLMDFEKRTGIRCEFFPPGEDISLDADLSTALFRIFQEALTNVARHSRATEVRTRLRKEADIFTLEVEDNGKGIEKKKALSSKSLGLLGMRERAQMFGGRLTVSGTPGTGTRVTVEISPVEKRKTERKRGERTG